MLSKATEHALAREAGQASIDKESVLHDYNTCCISREVSLLGRREVLTGKAKFGIFGDGKEVPQIAMARAFRQGDFRSGYYRDQTFMFALGLCSVEQFFAQLYADADHDPFSGGRQMNGHFATPLIDAAGNWLSQRERYNVSSDISSTGGQMARALGLALASKKYRNNAALPTDNPFSANGDEVSFCTIGDASTSEGIFWETINAAGVMQVPLAVCVWDDGYGISVPRKYQTTKDSISEVLKGFAHDGQSGIDLYTAPGWDYPALLALYSQAIAKVRAQHRPALLHITELTQPQGHSTSGSHERYKDKDRLAWEQNNDCLLRMAQWIEGEGMATAQELEVIRLKARVYVKECRDRAWKNFTAPVKHSMSALQQVYADLPEAGQQVADLKQALTLLPHPDLSEALQNARRMAIALRQQGQQQERLQQWIAQIQQLGHQRYHTHLYSSSEKSALRVPVVPPLYAETPNLKSGYEILNLFFDQVLSSRPEVYAFGEDVGQIGDVNQGFAGMQQKHGRDRVFDTGIREWSIMGQAIGMAMRGLRPIAEIQYLDYLLYGLSPLSDDLATLRYRSNNLQQAPVIVRTRGHRLEGIWHAGSPLGMIVHALRGMYVLVPRSMVQAAGFYNTLLQSDDPALVIECLNGYRLKEAQPENIGEYTVPLGMPEVLEAGSDLTLVTYGSCVRVAQAGLQLLAQQGISVELIDVQTLLPFDLAHRIVASLKKTSRLLVLDEDVPGGASAYMLREILEVQGGYRYLDAAPATLTAKAHRPPYGSDGDYFTKPNAEDVFEAVYAVMREAEPSRWA